MARTGDYDYGGFDDAYDQVAAESGWGYDDEGNMGRIGGDRDNNNDFNPPAPVARPSAEIRASGKYGEDVARAAYQELGRDPAGIRTTTLSPAEIAQAKQMLEANKAGFKQQMTTSAIASLAGALVPGAGLMYQAAEGLPRLTNREAAKQLLEQSEYKGFLGLGLNKPAAGYSAVYDENDNLVGSLAVDETGRPVGYLGEEMPGYEGYGSEFISPKREEEKQGGGDGGAFQLTPETSLMQAMTQVPQTTGVTAPVGISSLAPQPAAQGPMPAPQPLMPQTQATSVPSQGMSGFDIMQGAMPAPAPQPIQNQVRNPYLQIGNPGASQQQ
jgi:hypothetical protein